MESSWISRELHPRHVFRIARARRREVRNVFLRLSHDGVAGYGEASPNAFYDETWESVEARLAAARDWLATLRISSPADIEAAWHQGWQWLQPSRAAQCAVDLALWDWLARRDGVSVAELLWHEPPRPVPSFCTIGLSTPDELETKLDELDGFPLIKLKSDAAADLRPVAHVRERSRAVLAVDANCAWSPAALPALEARLAPLGVEFLEQPLPPGQDDQLPTSRLLPILADESCVVEDDVPRVAGHFDGFNIKLVKCGGLTPARRMVRLGEKLRRTMMVGCMLESSLLVAAGAAVAQRTRFADLDGAWLLADDPATGWQFDRGILRPPSGPGLGALPTGISFDDGSG
jgi:L-alanine-DL-glutamate epimerase-like enolase superfamily enzyme